MQSAADFERVIDEHATSMAAQRIGYAEISFNPSLHDGVDWLPGIERGRERALQEHGVEIAWLVEMVRGDSVESNEHALDVALATAGVVGLGLVGDEAADTSDLAPLVDRAHAKGLRFMPHVGQTGGPDVVRDAIAVLGADRVAHGVAALRDESVVRLVVDRDICLCVCPTSNARIGLRPDYGALARAGIPITVNSDDPAMVGTTLTNELDIAEREHGLDMGTLVAASWDRRFAR
jgi:aminodeoxyfutalosine deaminase